MNQQSQQRPVALVTGAAGGLGRVISSVLVTDGFRVAMVDKDPARLDAAAESLSGDSRYVLPVVADITDESSVRSSVAKVASAWGPVHALVHNAGIEPDHQIVGMSMAAWDSTFDVNVRASMLYVKHCAPAWIEQATGTVVLIGSRTWLSGSSHIAYAASKAALVGVARSVAAELGPRGVTANVVAPSFVRTALHTEEFNERYASAFEAATPLRRLIDPEDVAYAVSFLVSPRARNISGEVLHVAAGTQMAPTISV